jgi:nucleotide-binding universal stress UspA family protein
MRTAAELITVPSKAVVLTVWMPAAVQLARWQAFALPAPSNEADVDADEAAAAAAVAAQGAAAAQEHGYDAAPRIEAAIEGVVHSILGVADDIDAALIVCGQRGRGAVRTALLGSVSHALSGHTRRPVLIVPERRVR